MYICIVDSAIIFCISTTIQRKNIVPFLLQQFPYFYIVYGVMLMNSTRERAVAFPRQQWLYERATVLRDTYIAHLVICLARLFVIVKSCIILRKSWHRELPKIEDIFL